MAMDSILGGKVLINGTDIWKAYSSFLVEKKRGDRNNLKAIMAPAKIKPHVAVDIREENGEKYSALLDVKNQARDVKLYFALYADTREKWLSQYKAFIAFLKQGDDGWLDISFPDLDDFPGGMEDTHNVLRNENYEAGAHIKYLAFEGYKIPITDVELEGLKQCAAEYLDENGVMIGFVNNLLGL